MINDKTIRWLLFFINPFIAMLVSFKEYTLPYSKNIFWAFCVFYGLTFSVSNESLGSDIVVYVDKLQELYNRPELTVSEAIKDFQKSNEIDIFQPTIAYILSRFTNNQGILTMVYAIFFGYFFSRNIWYILNLLNEKINSIEKIIILSLILLIPIWYINGVRMWTAFHIFFYGLLPYIFENRRGKLIFVYLSFFVHFSFIVPISMVFLYQLIGDRLKLIFIIFIFSIVSSSLEITKFNEVVETYAPLSIATRTEGYRNEEAIEAKIEANIGVDTNWYVEWYLLGLRWALYLLIIYLYFFGNQHKKLSPDWKRLFSLALILFTIGNFLIGIPSGARFLNFGYFLSLLIILVYLNEFPYDIKLRRLLLVLSPAFFLFIIISIRLGLYSASITTFLGNPFVSIFDYGDTKSINDLIK